MLMVTRGNNQCVKISVNGIEFYIGVRRHAKEPGKFILAFFAEPLVRIDRVKKEIDDLWYEEKFEKEKANGSAT